MKDDKGIANMFDRLKAEIIENSKETFDGVSDFSYTITEEKLNNIIKDYRNEAIVRSTPLYHAAKLVYGFERFLKNKKGLTLKRP